MSYEYHHPRRVEFADTDMAGVIHFTSFFRYMEEAEHAFWRSLGLSVVARHDGETVSWPRVAAACDFLRPVFFEDMLDVHVWVAHKGRKSLRFCAAFTCQQPGPHAKQSGRTVQEGVLVARGRMTVACCICRPGQPLQSIAIPDDVAALVEVAPYGEHPDHEIKAEQVPGTRPPSDTQDARDFYDRISPVYDVLADASEHTSRERGLAMLAAEPGEAVLEIGFGTGHALVDLARSVGPEGRVCGLDVSEGMLSIARQRVRDAGVELTVKLELGDARALPFSDDSFDAVFMSYTLERFEGDELMRVLSEVRRVLRRGGRLGVVALARDQKAGLMSEVFQTLHRHFPHYVDCRPIDAPGLFRAAGLDVVDSTRMSMWGLPVIAVVGRKAAL